MRNGPTVLLLGAALVGLACASPVEIVTDERSDVGRWQSWDWLPGESMVISTPLELQPGARNRLAHLVLEGFERRGFERVRDEPDLHVGLVFAMRPTARMASETKAIEYLTSYHSDTYVIQAAESRVERANLVRLEVFVSERRSGRLVWQGRITGVEPGDVLIALSDTVGQLLEELPPRRAPEPGQTRVAGTAPR